MRVGVYLVVAFSLVGLTLAEEPLGFAAALDACRLDFLTGGEVFERG
jgi:hypothetical protein